jgi:hypothetical protein
VITNTGKSIIGKYLLGNTPSYASYIAVGCGATPLDTVDASGDYSTKTNLDFEMFRVPISSKGFVNEGGVDKLVFTAELPTEERYEISEVGLYSAGSNPSAGAYDSKPIFIFTQGEDWQYFNGASMVAIDTVLSALDSPANNNVISVEDPVFQTNANNAIFSKANRDERYERPRFLNNAIMMQGDEADITISEESGLAQDHFVIESGSNYIKLSGKSFDFSKNSPTDELRLAFSLVSKNGNSFVAPYGTRVLIEFASTNGTEYARFEAEVLDDSSGGQYDLSTERYFVVKKQLQELYTSQNFTWDLVTNVKIYSCVLIEDSGPTPLPSSDYYIALDALRLENISSVSPTYGLVGYVINKSAGATTLVKNPNTSNYIEFRFGLDVFGGTES